VNDRTGPSDAVLAEAPAKVNLFLAVTGRRPDGYHDLVTLMCPVGLADRLTLRFDVSWAWVRCDHPRVPSDESNLALRAARRFFDAVGRPARVGITIDKQIPVAAGLGGGSSDAAAVLTALNRRYGSPLQPRALVRIGRELGADVPFFLLGRPAIARGIGDQLTPFADLFPYSAVIVHPHQPVSTAEVYKNLNLALTKCQETIKWYPLNGRELDTARHLCNDLEGVTVSICPDVKEIKTRLLDRGARGVIMSGSGPCVVGLFKDRVQSLIAGAALRPAGRWTVYETSLSE
jgi:4-diphosphocytidyl-2-C-methyl-D-erythritol kinase